MKKETIFKDVTFPIIPKDYIIVGIPCECNKVTEVLFHKHIFVNGKAKIEKLNVKYEIIKKGDIQWVKFLINEITPDTHIKIKCEFKEAPLQLYKLSTFNFQLYKL